LRPRSFTRRVPNQHRKVVAENIAVLTPRLCGFAAQVGSLSDRLRQPASQEGDSSVSFASKREEVLRFS
jgi:hypothetical protein